MISTVPVHCFGCGLGIELALMANTHNSLWRRILKKPEKIDPYNFEGIAFRHRLSSSVNAKGKDELKSFTQLHGLDWEWITKNSKIKLRIAKNQDAGCAEYYVGTLTISAPYWRAEAPGSIEPPQKMSLKLRFNGFEDEKRETYTYVSTMEIGAASSFEFSFVSHVKIYRRYNAQYALEELLTSKQENLRHFALAFSANEEAMRRRLLTFNQKI